MFFVKNFTLLLFLWIFFSATKIVLINVAVLVLSGAQYIKGFALLFLLGMLIEGVNLSRS